MTHIYVDHRGVSPLWQTLSYKKEDIKKEAYDEMGEWEGEDGREV